MYMLVGIAHCNFQRGSILLLGLVDRHQAFVELVVCKKVCDHLYNVFVSFVRSVCGSRKREGRKSTRWDLGHMNCLVFDAQF